jgi:hypothetical protein
LRLLVTPHSLYPARRFNQNFRTADPGRFADTLRHLTIGDAMTDKSTGQEHQVESRRCARPPITRLLASVLVVALLGSAAVAADVQFVFGPQQDARAWLSSQGFQFKLDAGNASKVRFGLGERGLTIETLAAAEPILARDGINVAQPAHLTVRWGVDRYPTGANWDRGVNNEAIMVMVQFGHEQLPGGFFLPPRPYFIGFFLCDAGRRGIAISGRSYARQGR